MRWLATQTCTEHLLCQYLVRCWDQSDGSALAVRERTQVQLATGSNSNSRSSDTLFQTLKVPGTGRQRLIHIKQIHLK